MTSQSLRLKKRSATRDGSRRRRALHGNLHHRDLETEPRLRETAEEVAVALGPRAGHQPDAQGRIGQRQGGVAPQQALLLELAQQPRPLRRQPAQEGGDVDFGQNQADLSLGAIEVDAAAQDHDHPLGQLDPLLGQRVAERRPRRAPALHAQRGHAPTATRAGRAVFVGVDQVQVEVARAVVGEVADLAADPELAGAGKGPGEGGLHLVVEGADGEDVWMRLAVELGVEVIRRRFRALRWRGRPVGRRQSLGVEELAGAVGHAPTPYRRAARHPALAGRGTIAGDGESAGWPRHGSQPRYRVEEGRDSAEQGAG